MAEPGMGLFFRHVGQQPQRQDSLEDQLKDLHRVASRLGCYDAADWLWKQLASDEGTIRGTRRR